MAEYAVEIVEGPDAGTTFQLGSETVEIGRETGVGVELANDHLVSRRHARIRVSGDTVQIEDLGSRNGTFVDGDQIHSPAVVVPGNEITVGVSVLALRATGAAGAPETRVVPLALTKVHEARPAGQPPPAARGPVEPGPVPPAPAAPGPSHGEGGLARPERPPDFVPGDLHGRSASEPPLHGLLDKNTKRMARTAPLAIFAIAALVVIVALALR